MQSTASLPATTGTSTLKPMEKDLAKISQIVGNLPAMPIVATKVLQLIEDEKATADELAKIVAADPVVAARVLKITNTAYYGCQRQIQTLPSAIVLIGFNTLKSLVLAASVNEMFKTSGLTGKMLWEQSFGAGLAARNIARKIRGLNPDEAFLAGLLQDIGKIIMHHYDQGKFQMVIEQYYNEGISFNDAETLYYPFTHAELGGYVLQNWNFPEMLVTAVSKHHSFDFTGPEDDYLCSMTAVANLANLFCAKLGIGERTPREDLDLAETMASKLLELDEDQLEESLESFREAYEKDKSYFG
jgi:HD-like signal output (HDOD) protein